MVKGTWRTAGPDDPIYAAGKPDSQDAKQGTTLRGVELIRARRASAERLKELGLLSRDDLVISTKPSPRQTKNTGGFVISSARSTKVDRHRGAHMAPERRDRYPDSHVPIVKTALNILLLLQKRRRNDGQGHIENIRDAGRSADPAQGGADLVSHGAELAQTTG